MKSNSYHTTDGSVKLNLSTKEIHHVMYFLLRGGEPREDMFTQE